MAIDDQLQWLLQQAAEAGLDVGDIQSDAATPSAPRPRTPPLQRGATQAAPPPQQKPDPVSTAAIEALRALVPVVQGNMASQDAIARAVGILTAKLEMLAESKPKQEPGRLPQPYKFVIQRDAKGLMESCTAEPIGSTSTKH